MALTVTLQRGSEDVRGNMRRNVLSINFDSSYPDGGETLTPRQLGLSTVDHVPDVLHQGHLIKYDRANQRLQVFKPNQPFVIIEHTGTFTAGAAYTMKHRPGYVLGIRGTAGSTGSKRVIPAGETPAADEVALNWTTGVLTWGDAGITAAIIMYVPLGAPGFTEDLLVVDEVVNVSTDSGNLANRAAAICVVWDDSNNNPLTIVPVGEAPGAGACAIDINNSGNTTITVNSGGTTDSLKVTYLKYNAAIHERMLRWVDQADIALTLEAVTFSTNGLVLPGFGQCIVGEDGTAGNQFATLVDIDGTAANLVATWDPWTNTITTNNNTAMVTLELPLLRVPAELAGGMALEMPDGSDLSWLTGVRLEAVGY